MGNVNIHIYRNEHESNMQSRNDGNIKIVSLTRHQTLHLLKRHEKQNIT